MGVQVDTNPVLGFVLDDIGGSVGITGNAAQAVAGDEGGGVRAAHWTESVASPSRPHQMSSQP